MPDLPDPCDPVGAEGVRPIHAFITPRNRSMTRRERHKRRREANRATLGPVAEAPSFKAVRKKHSKRSMLRRRLIAATFAAVVIAVIAVPKVSRADFNPVPEIDPGSMAGAMTLLVGGFLALTDRARRS
jgi:hypothetical protein